MSLRQDLGVPATHALQPDLVPIGVYAPRAEQSIGTEATATGHTIEDQTRIGQAHHLAVLLIDDLLDLAEHAVCVPAIRHHLDVELETSILEIVVEGAHDLPLRAHLNELPGLQVEFITRRLAASQPLEVRVGTAAPMQAHDRVERGDEHVANESPQPHVPGEEVAQVMAWVPPCERRRRPEELRSLAAILFPAVAVRDLNRQVRRAEGVLETEVLGMRHGRW